MPGFRDFLTGLRNLEIEPASPIVVHASLSAFGDVQGGADTIMGALMSLFHTIIMPTFTYHTMVIPEIGPPDNGITYGSGRNTNRLAEFFHVDMPADRMMGVLAENLRRHPAAKRSRHPILSFAGVNAHDILVAQTINEPLAPLRKIEQAGGWVLLMGVDHTVNTSIHLAEWYAGRKQFVRWALTSKGIVACPGFPGCSLGFQAFARYAQDIVRVVNVGAGVITAVPIAEQTTLVRKLLSIDPAALLCSQPDCERCFAVRAQVKQQS
jgi:aminoglycoside 3-N-acetyltransferase